MSDKKIRNNIVTIDENLIKTVIGCNIQKIRESKKISRMKLAEMVEVSISGMRKIELGLSYTSIFTIVKIAIALGTTCDYLLTNGCEICYLDTVIRKIHNEISESNIKPRSF